MNDLEDRVITSLRDQADRSGTFTGLEQAAIPRARKLRRRQRVLAGVACVTVLAIGVPAIWNAIPSARTSLVPASTPVHKVRIDLERLPKGPPPKVLYVEDGVIHDDDKEISLRTTYKRPYDIVRLGDGYVVQFQNNEVGILDVWVGPDGKKKREVPSPPVISPNGKRAAFSAWGGVVDESDTELRIMDVETETITDRKTVKGLAVTRGFIGAGVVFDDGDGNKPAGLWNTRTSEVSYFDQLDAGGADGWHWLGAQHGERFLGLGPAERDCSGMYDADGSPSWRTCDDILRRVSADGRYAFGADRDSDATIVRDAVSGIKVFELTGAGIDTHRATAEPDGGILVTAVGVDDENHNPTREALVRCKPDGTCERASDLVKLPPSGEPAADTPVIVSDGSR